MDDERPRRIVFVSYKGGAGRTHALVSIGNLLARCGEHVLLIDLDIDAPGVATLCGATAFRDGDEPLTGVMPWVMSGADPHDLLGHTQNLTEDELPSGGTLRLLPAGQIDRGYLEMIASPVWSDNLGQNDLDDERSALAIALDKGLAVLGAELGTAAPTVILIDARAGIGPLSGTLVVDIADTVAFFLTGDADAMRIYRWLADGAGGRGVAVQPVLSRIPHFLPAAVRAAEEKIERYLGLPDPDVIVFLRGAPGREVSDGPAIGLYPDSSPSVDALGAVGAITSEGPDREVASFVAASDLAIDHVKLLLRLLPAVRPPDVEDDPGAAALFDPDNLERTIDYKLFRSLDGRIYNLDDKQRNVSFRTATINQMFDAIYDELVTKVDPSMPPGWLDRAFRRVGAGLSDDRVEDAFRSSGSQAGATFAKTYVESLKQDKVDARLERLRRWCVFDSAVGFGKFRCTEGPEGRFTVTVADPFMKGPGGGGLVLEGYVLNVMQTILENEYNLEVTWPDDCLVVVATKRAPSA